MSDDYPIVGYRFMVTIFTFGVPNPVDTRFKEVSGLQLARSIERENSILTLPKNAPAQTLTLKRGVMKGASPLTLAQIKEIELWQYYAQRKELLVSVVDASDIPLNSWLISDAYLETWSWDGVNGGSNDVLIESMAFKYNKIRYIPTGV